MITSAIAAIMDRPCRTARQAAGRISPIYVRGLNAMQTTLALNER